MSARPHGELGFLCAAIRAQLPGQAFGYDHAEVPLVAREPLRTAAAAHRVLPLLARAAGAHAEPELQQEARRIAMRALGATDTLRRAIAALSSADVRALAWKGPAVAQLAWGDVGCRESDDLDLVVAQADRARARAALRDAGWTSRHAMSEAQEEAIFRGLGAWEFVGSSEPPLLELHWEFSARRYAGRLPAEAVIARAVPVRIGGGVCLAPDPADTLALLAQHASKHGWGRLEDLALFAALAARDDEAVVEAHTRAATVGGGRAVRLGLELARRMLAVRPPSGLADAIAQDAGAAAMAEQVVARWTRGETAFHPTLAWDLRWTEGAAARLRFLARATLDPTMQEWKAIQLPDPLVGLYPLVRSARRGWAAVTRRAESRSPLSR